MGSFNQLLCLSLLQPRQVDVQVDIQTEATRNLANTNLGSDRALGWQGLFLLAGNELQGAIKQAE